MTSMKAYPRFGFVLFLTACAGPAAAPPPPAAPAPVVPAPAPTPAASVATPAPFDDASLLYLEEVQGREALDFARAHNAASLPQLTADPRFGPLEERLRAIYSSKQKVPWPTVNNGIVRNFWTDDDHPRGIWRETTVADYKSANPKWTTLLDIDALNKAENASFVWKGADCLYPSYRRCLVSLSPGGGDAVVVREFDLDKKAFVQNGFVLAEGKSNVSWKDLNTLVVGTDFGPGTLTTAGYPRIAKEWKRGTPLASAKPIFEVKDTDVDGGCYRSFDHDRKRDYCARTIDFEHTDLSIMRGGKLVLIDKPSDAEVGIWDDQILLRLRSDWTLGSTTFKKGSLLISALEPYMAGKRDVQVLFEPTPHASLDSWTGTKTRIVTNVLSDVKNQVTVFTRPAASKGKWVGTPLQEPSAALGVFPFDALHSDDVWLWLTDFTVPYSLERWSTTTGKRELYKREPSFFDAHDLEVTQHFATSKDGTKIPYFEVGKKGRTSAGPTLLTAYGGFEISLSAGYDSTVGASWLERGGTFVQANLRGGGEYGPAWHEAATKHNRQNAYDDLAAVAEDLVQRGVTTAKQLGVIGGSNGGLLTSVMLTQRPELFGAIVSEVPLTDMKRYHKLLAGASWMSEYGDPDNAEDWAALSKFSPLQNIRRDVTYPPVFYTTSTKDDRVHPAHARKMVAKLEAFGHKPLYYENIEGGHGGAADITQAAHRDALVYTFLAAQLGLP
jgi:prolyl oligopeptidase